MKTPPIAAIFPVVIIASLSVSSCQSIKTPPKLEDIIGHESNKSLEPPSNKSLEPPSNKSLEPPSNVVKVLNSITCSDCNQDQVKTIWKECLNQGYIQKSPNQKVIASRDISELVSANYTSYTTQYYTVESTDANGIVTSDQHSRQIPQYTTLNGQCRGSEYILQ